MVAALAAATICIHAAGHAGALVTVDVPSARSTTAVMRVYRRSGSCWRQVAGPWPARVGNDGVSAHHREGDGTTPLGTFAIGPTAYGVAPDPGTAFAYHRLVCGDWWDEDPSTANYNHRTGLRRRQRGALASDSRLRALPLRRVQRSPGRARPWLGDLHPRRRWRADERLRERAAGRSRFAAAAGFARGRARDLDSPPSRLSTARSTSSSESVSTAGEIVTPAR
jgi:hypothetical protein